jgi:hypothetical protein
VLLCAALVPDTALLVPGAAGTATVLAAERAAALDAVRQVVGKGPDVVVVVGGSPRRSADADRTGAVVATLAAAGIPDGWVADDWSDGDSAAPESATAVRESATAAADGAPGRTPTVLVQDTAPATGLLLLRAVGWTGPVRVLELSGDVAGPARRTLGADLVRDGRVGLLLLGSLSARRGPDAPLPEDPRAPDLDERLLADLVALDGQARSRLASVPPELAQELAVSAWTVWQVLLGAAEGQELTARLHHVGAPFGATYATLSWTVR